MLTVGIDSIEINRLIPWTQFSSTKLARIFSEEEISYSLSAPVKAAERLAVRFAVKEAFYKAVVPLLNEHQPFMKVGKEVSVTYDTRHTPNLLVNWSSLGLTSYQAQISLTHTQSMATAIVIIESTERLT